MVKNALVGAGGKKLDFIGIKILYKLGNICKLLLAIYDLIDMEALHKSFKRLGNSGLTGVEVLCNLGNICSLTIIEVLRILGDAWRLANNEVFSISRHIWLQSSRLYQFYPESQKIRFNYLLISRLEFISLYIITSSKILTVSML